MSDEAAPARPLPGAGHQLPEQVPPQLQESPALTLPAAARQALRMRRFLSGSAASSLVLLALLYCVQTGLLERRVFAVAVSLIVGLNLLFFALFRSGLNRHFADHSLTAEQLVLSSSTLFYVAYHAGSARPAFVFVVLAVFLFGVFRLHTRQLLLIALFDVLSFAALIVWLPLQGGAYAADLRVDALLLLMMGVTLIGFSLMARQISGLRRSVETRNRELATALQSLKRREDDLLNVQRLAKLGSWSRDWQDNEVLWSDEQYRIVGVERASHTPTKDNFAGFVHQQDLQRYRDYVAQSLRTGEDIEIELRLVQPAGGVRWVRMQRHTVAGAAGVIQRQYGTVLDISDAKQSERRLGMQHAVTKVLAEAGSLAQAMPAILGIIGEAQDWVAAACWRSARDGATLRCVDTWTCGEPLLETFGAQQRAAPVTFEIEREGLLMTAWRTRLPHWIADVMQAPGYRRAAAAGPAGLHGGFVVPVVAGGEVLRLLEFYSYDAREPDAMLVDLAQSLGNQIGQFIERRSAETALTQAREHLNMAVKASGIGFWDWEVHSDVTHYSEQVGPMLGFEAGSMPAGQSAFLELVHPADRPALHAANVAGIKSGLPHLIELRLRRRDGAWRWFLARAQVFCDADGRTAGMAGSLADIEDRKRLDRAKDEFVATVSHELRTPLTSIRGALGLLDGGVAGELPDDARELVRVSLSGAERLSRLVNDVLNLAKIESGALAVAPVRLVLDALVHAAITANQPYCRGFGVQLSGMCGIPGAMVLADADRLMQIAGNLISNAAKFSPAGGEVMVTTARIGGKLRLAVIDHGTGIPESFRARLFQKFAQVDGTDGRAKQGSGLGLNICRALVMQMGGTIDFEATPGGGATFYVDLPEACAQATATDVVAPGGPPTAAVAVAGITVVPSILAVL